MKYNIFAILILVGAMLVSCEQEYEVPMEIHDVSWYTSERNDAEQYVVSSGEFLAFMDLSQGALTHQWTISEGAYYLKDGFTKSDSLPLFRDEDKGLTTDDYVINVFFETPGLKEINLRNTFSQKVSFNGDTKVEAVKEGDAWVFDTTFVVDVFGAMKPAFKVYQLIEDETGAIVEEKEILSITEEDEPDEDNSDNWETIDVEVGGRLKFVDLTTTDRPTGRTWRVNNKPNYTETSSQEEAIVFFSVYGFQTEKLGSFTSVRNGENIPVSSVNKLIPLKVNVISSTKPFRYAGAATKIGRDKITLSLSGEVGEMTNAEGAFTVHVSNTNKGLDGDVAVSSVNTKTGDKTILELSLAESVYEDDVITVAYDNSIGTITSVDERTLQNIATTSVSIELGGTGMFNDPNYFGFEEYAEGQPANTPGYWHPNAGPWWRSEDQAFESNASMKYSWDITDDLGDGNVFWGWDVDEKVSGIPAGQYIMSVNIYVEEGSDISTLDVKVGNGALSWDNIMTTALDLSGLTRGEWHTIQQPVEFVQAAADGDGLRWGWHVYPGNNPGVTGVQTFYFDNYQIQPVDARP